MPGPMILADTIHSIGKPDKAFRWYLPLQPWLFMAGFYVSVPIVSLVVSATWDLISPTLISLFVGSIAERRAAYRLANGDALQVSDDSDQGALYRKSTWNYLFSLIFSLMLGTLVSSSVDGETVSINEKMDVLKLNGFKTVSQNGYRSTTTSYKFYFGESDKCNQLSFTNKTRRIESWSGIWFEVKKQKTEQDIVELKPTGRYECKNDYAVIVTYQGWDDGLIGREDTFQRKFKPSQSQRVSKTLCSTADKGLCYAVDYFKADVTVPQESAKVKKGYYVNNYFDNFELWVYPVESSIRVRVFDPAKEGWDIQGKWATIAGNVDIEDVISSISILGKDEITGDVYKDLRNAFLLGLSSRGKQDVIVTSKRDLPKYEGFEKADISIDHTTVGKVNTTRIFYVFLLLGILALLRMILVKNMKLDTGDVAYEKLNIENSLYIASLAVANSKGEDGNEPEKFKRAVIKRENNTISIRANRLS